MLIRDFVKPYQSKIDRDHREFARRFWNEAPQELTVCLDADLDLKPYVGSFETAYLCHHRIYAPLPNRGSESIGERIAAAEQPLRCVAIHSASAQRNATQLTDWVHGMQERYDLVGTETHNVPLSKTHNEYFDLFLMQYDVYHFRPKTSGLSVARQKEPRTSSPQRAADNVASPLRRAGSVSSRICRRSNDRAALLISNTRPYSFPSFPFARFASLRAIPLLFSTLSPFSWSHPFIERPGAALNAPCPRNRVRPVHLPSTSPCVAPFRRHAIEKHQGANNDRPRPGRICLAQFLPSRSRPSGSAPFHTLDRPRDRQTEKQCNCRHESAATCPRQLRPVFHRANIDKPKAQNTGLHRPRAASSESRNRDHPPSERSTVRFPWRTSPFATAACSSPSR